MPYGNERAEKPFFNELMPREIKEKIISFLPGQDWESLLYVSKEWQALVISLANAYYEAIEPKLEPILSFDYTAMMEELNQEVSIYTLRKMYFATGISDIFTLIKEVSLLDQPLAKLVYIQCQVTELMKGMQKTSNNSLNIFAQSNPIYFMLQPIKEQCEALTYEKWFQKAALTQGLTSIENNKFSDAFLEIEALEAAKAAVTLSSTQSI